MILASCLSDNTDAESEISLGIGDSVPQFSVVTTQGETISTSTILSSGKRTLICFFNTTCKDCQRQLPEVEQAYRQLEDPDKYIIVAISRAQKADAVTDYWTKNGMTLPVAPQADRKVYNLFASSVIPRLYFIDAFGIIRHIADANNMMSAEEILRKL